MTSYMQWSWIGCVNKHSLLMLCVFMRPLPCDLRCQVGTWLHLKCICWCRGCGVPLVCINKHRDSVVSHEAKYSYDFCTMCYHTCQA